MFVCAKLRSLKAIGGGFFATKLNIASEYLNPERTSKSFYQPPHLTVTGIYLRNNKINADDWRECRGECNECMKE